MYVLKKSKKTAVLIASSDFTHYGRDYGFVPFDPKTGQFDFADLVPGAYYYYPPNKVFVQSVPPSEGEEGGIYQINPYTFQRSKVE